MTKVKARQKALGLRLESKMSYNQIRKIVGVSKSTLSRWLKNYPLSKKRIGELRDRNAVRIEKFRETMRAKREKRLKRFYREEKQRWLPLSRRELFVAGLFLYWGEGVKALKSSVSLNNTDPKMVKFYLYWLTEVLRIHKAKIKVHVHLYSDMDIDKELNFWSKELKIPLSQFNKSYIKRSKKADIDHRGFGRGTCALVINDVRLKERIMMGIKVIAGYYSEKI